jgi:hypothetical protein
MKIPKTSFCITAVGLVATVMGSFACSDDVTASVNQLNLDRPVDVAFACYGGLRITGNDGAQPADPVVVSAQPTTGCEVRTKRVADGAPLQVPPGQEDLRPMGGAQLSSVSWYGLILQSVPGTVALARFEAKPSEKFEPGDVLVLDADPLTPGKNGISVGVEPIALATDNSGCFAVTANAGSCDASIIDLGTALAADGNAK